MPEASVRKVHQWEVQCGRLCRDIIAALQTVGNGAKLVSVGGFFNDPDQITLIFEMELATDG